MRTFRYKSQLLDGTLALALAPALTPAGIDYAPSFFKGFVSYPQIVARGLLVLADVTSTRYFNFKPTALRDPVLSAQGNRLRAECFSACNGVYARLDLQSNGIDGQIGFGTTNVDIGIDLRTALTRVRQEDKLYVNIGAKGLITRRISDPGGKTAHLDTEIQERPVQMPDRWIRAFGNAAEIHKQMQAVFTLNGAQAKAFATTLPSATGKHQSGWLTPSRTGAKLVSRRTSNAVFVSGLHRLSALKRVMTNITEMTFYMPQDGQAGAFMVETQLPGARITFSMTAEAWQGYSGEGSLLMSLAHPDLLEDAEAIASVLTFDAVVDTQMLAKQWNIDEQRVNAALSVLAVSGKLGFDAHDRAYFHRELPDDPDRVLKDNPRLNAARKLIGEVRYTGENTWIVPSNGTEYRVYFNPSTGTPEAGCTCTWYLNHQNRRGPCKHILSVKLKEMR